MRVPFLVLVVVVSCAADPVEFMDRPGTDDAGGGRASPGGAGGSMRTSAGGAAGHGGAAGGAGAGGHGGAPGAGGAGGLGGGSAGAGTGGGHAGGGAQGGAGGIGAGGAAPDAGPADAGAPDAAAPDAEPPPFAPDFDGGLAHEICALDGGDILADCNNDGKCESTPPADPNCGVCPPPIVCPDGYRCQGVIHSIWDNVQQKWRPFYAPYCAPK